MKRILAFVLLFVMALELCACKQNKNPEQNPGQNPDEPQQGETLNIISADAEMMGFNVIVMLNSEDGIFKEAITGADVEVCIHYKGDDAKTDIATEELTVKYQTENTVGMNFCVERNIDLVAIKIKASGTIDAKEYVASTEVIPVSLGAADNAIAADIAAIKEMLSKGVLDYGVSIASIAASAYNLLGALGVVKTKQLNNIELIQKGVSQLSGQVDALSKKLDTVYVNLKEELDKIKDTTKETLRNTYYQNWNSFKTDYMDKNGGIFQQINKFNNNYSSNFCNVSSKKDGTFNIYYDVDGAVTLPLSEAHEKGKKWISIDNKVIDESKTISFAIDENTFKKSNALKIKAIDNQTYSDTFIEELKAALLTAENVNDDNIEAITEDALASISAEVTMETMNQKTENGTIADDIIDNYMLFCDKLCERDMNPISSYHNLIIAHYNFQSEAKADIDSFNGFILAKAAQALEYAELASRFGSIRESKKKGIYDYSQNVVDYFEKNSGLVPEKDGMQFCYTTNSYVSATQYTALLHETITCHLGERIFYTAGVFDEYKYSLEWNKTPQNVISTSDLADIYAIYSALYANGITKHSFRDYFIGTLASDSVHRTDITNIKAVGLISGNQGTKRNFELDGSTRLRTYGDVFSGRSKGAAVHAPCDYFEPDTEYNIGTQSAEGDANKEYFAEHSSLYSDVMDITNGKFYTDKQLVSGAMYIEEHGYFAVAELWEFAGIANLSNKADWSTIEHDYYGDPTKISSLNIYYTDYINYVLQGSATFWAIVKE